MLTKHDDPSQPATPPTEADPTAISDLTTLAAELTQRGHTTQLITTTPPHLKVDRPGIAQPQHIYAEPEWFCWYDPARPFGPAPFTLRTTPLSLTADRAHQLMQVLIQAHQMTHAPTSQHPAPHRQDTP